MSQRKSRNQSEYKVGYGWPPKASQFRPGQSGNPSGRRKASPTIGARLRALMYSKVTVTEQGRPRRISRLDLMLGNDAMRGDKRAFKLLMEFFHRYGAAVEGAAVRSEEMTSDDLEILSDYLRKCGSSSSDNTPTREATTMAKTSEARVLRALLRHDLSAFVRKVFATLESGQAYVANRHLKATAYQLERVRRGEIRRLIINMPPRSLKSVMASVGYPAFILGHDPTRRIICASYSAALATKHANDFRGVLEALWYRELFPCARIGQKDSEAEIELTARGFRLATSGRRHADRTWRRPDHHRRSSQARRRSFRRQAQRLQ
jgi:hypothetical protein